MKTILRYLLIPVVALFAASAPAAVPESDMDRSRASQARLDAVLAPIALYPDALLSQLLMAATYPRDVAEAAAFSRARPDLKGEDAVRAVENEPWDPSVKSLVAFPQVLAMMDERMQWTEDLGEYFMENPQLVSDTIQVLRGRADQAGNLRSSSEQVVRRDYDAYVIEPAAPEVVYVPYYDPRVVYGQWWWPGQEPVWWSPWSGYSWTVGHAGLGWGYGAYVGSGFFYSSFDWPRRYIRFHNQRPWYRHGWSHNHGHRWWNDREHRHNVRDRGEWRRGDDRRGDSRRGSRGRPDEGGSHRAAAPGAPRYRDQPRGERNRNANAPRVQQAAPVGRGYGGRASRPPEASERRQASPVAREARPVYRQAAPAFREMPAGQPAARSQAPAVQHFAREPRRQAPAAQAPAPRAPQAPAARESRHDGGGARGGGGGGGGRMGGRHQNQ